MKDILEGITRGLVGETASTRIEVNFHYHNGIYVCTIHGNGNLIPGGHHHRKGSRGRGSSQDPVQALLEAVEDFHDDLEVHIMWAEESLNYKEKVAAGRRKVFREAKVFFEDASQQLKNIRK